MRSFFLSYFGKIIKLYFGKSGTKRRLRDSFKGFSDVQKQTSGTGKILGTFAILPLLSQSIMHSLIFVNIFYCKGTFKKWIWNSNQSVLRSFNH